MRERESDEQVNLGLEKLKEFMEPGEVFLGNWKQIELHNKKTRYEEKSKGTRIMYTSGRTAQKVAHDIKESGKYESVRVIGKAFTIDGQIIPGYNAIVVKPIAS